MATVDVRDAQGEVVEQRELPAALFGAPVNVPLMHQVVTAGLAAQRAGTHATKTRGDVRGGGVKPWRQKGTGRARHGSIRSPIWSGGGVAHGPQPRDYSQRVNKKMKKAALRSALSDAAQNGKLAVVSPLAFDGPRTKDAVSILEALDLEGRILVVLPGPDEAVEKSFRNLAYVKVDYPGNLSTYDVLYADSVLFTSEALDELLRAAGETTERPDGTGRSEPDGPEEREAETEPSRGPEPEPAAEPDQELQGDENPEMPEEAGV